MVARKPLPDSANVPPQFTAPLNMADTKEPPLSSPPDAKPTERPEDLDSDADSWERTSASEDEEQDEGQEPHPHNHEEQQSDHPAAVGGGDGAIGDTDHGEGPSTLPLAMTGGPGDGATSNTPDSDQSAPAISAPAETNPFRRKMSQSSGLHSVTVPPLPTDATPMPSSEDLAKLSLTDASTNPWNALGDQENPLPSTTLSTVAAQEPGQDIWGSQVPSRAASTAPPPSDSQAEHFATPVESADWDDHAPKDSFIEVPASFQKRLEGEALDDDSHAWDDAPTQDKGKATMIFPQMPRNLPEGAREEEWNLIDDEPRPGPSVAAETSQASEQVNAKAPELPPRSDEKTPLAPPRTLISAKAETYQVKNINWRDANGFSKPRKTPILVQNANGPCPLMALVNALTMTTPADAEEAVLVNTLRTREQISLDLLLNAVFDELMSERRMTGDVPLPDVTELYAFLLGLHTGMNVNPRFLPTEEMEKAFKRTSLTHLHPHERGDLIPGTFEDTQEMAFYRIFQVPLIHGWLPSKDDTVYDALKRQAVSYEDAQNLLFREEELEDKLKNPNSEGLTEDEQALYHDILNIKTFLHTSATQLTTWGLEIITKAMPPGSVAILFRNDHFSTLYRHPQTLEIFALVTDAGYAGHEEVVWESLRDINGERSEFFSGDFRIVGGTQDSHQAASGSASAASQQTGFSDFQDKKGKEKISHSETTLSPSEQEDHDLALAMQLQEEEDQRHNNEQAQRRRESQLSEQFIEQQAANRGSAGGRQTTSGQQAASTPSGRRPSTAASTPTRSAATPTSARGGRPAGPQQVRSLVPPVLRSQGVNRASDAEGDDAPPSYEDAARDRPYIPPAGHPSHADSNLGAPTVSTPRLAPSRAPGVAGVPGPSRQPSGMQGRRGGSMIRQGVPPATTSGGGREKDCIVM